MVPLTHTGLHHHKDPLSYEYEQPGQLTHRTPPKPTVYIVQRVRRTPTAILVLWRDPARWAHGTPRPHQPQLHKQCTTNFHIEIEGS